VTQDPAARPSSSSPALTPRRPRGPAWTTPSARARAYIQAGADMIFPEGLASEAEFAQFAHALLKGKQPEHPGPHLPPRQHDRVRQDASDPHLPASRPWATPVSSTPSPCSASPWAPSPRALADLKRDGSVEGFLKQMQTREELYNSLAISQERHGRLARKSRGSLPPTAASPASCLDASCLDATLPVEPSSPSSTPATHRPPRPPPGTGQAALHPPPPPLTRFTPATASAHSAPTFRCPDHSRPSEQAPRALDEAVPRSGIPKASRPDPLETALRRRWCNSDRPRCGRKSGGPTSGPRLHGLGIGFPRAAVTLASDRRPLCGQKRNTRLESSMRFIAMWSPCRLLGAFASFRWPCAPARRGIRRGDCTRRVGRASAWNAQHWGRPSVAAAAPDADQMVHGG